jgi:endo-1,4-beta-xylanase
MMKRFAVSYLIICTFLAAAAYGQNAAVTAPATGPSANSDQAAAKPALPATLKGLKDVYADKFLIGTAGDIPRGYSDIELANIKANYNIITPENCMKPQNIHPSEETYSWATADALVKFCEDNNIKLWGHCLLWHSQTGQWFFRGADGQPASREVALEKLKSHIMTEVGRYKGKVLGWDVVNEAINDAGAGQTENLRNMSWYRTVGPDVITLAFKWAHEADPQAELYYNDYNIEQGAATGTGKFASTMMLLKRIKQEGAPITGVGIQGHWHFDTKLADVEKAITEFAALGLKVGITEFDIPATGATNSGAFPMGRGRGNVQITPQALQQQAKIYAQMFEIFLRHAKDIERVTFWGISDRRSWLGGQQALVYDGQMFPKPAYQAIIDMGLGRYVEMQPVQPAQPTQPVQPAQPTQPVQP